MKLSKKLQSIIDSVQDSKPSDIDEQNEIVEMAKPLIFGGITVIAVLIVAVLFVWD